MTADQRASEVRAFVADPNNVSTQQRVAVKKDGNFFLTACPGSGKTRTVGVRLAYWSAITDPELDRCRRVAATSYTNTAVREILRAADDAGGSASDPHFVGTLHKFLIRYVLRPFGRQLMGCSETPRIVASPAGRKAEEETLGFKIQWTKSKVSIWDFHWRANGTLTIGEVPFELRDKIEAPALSRTLQERAIAAKEALARRGLLSMSDALYWAMRVLEVDDYARAVACRFDELIVDEAQDTSDVQQNCIRRLFDAGLGSLVFVGDMNQAIYGFAHAQPTEIEQLVGSTVKDRILLSENWRSSQALCDVTVHFSRNETADEAVGPFRDYDESPAVFFYEDGDEQSAVSGFIEHVSNLGLDPSQSVVLCRWNATTEALSGASSVALRSGLRSLVDGVAAARGYRRFDSDVVRDVESMILALVDPDGNIDDLEPDDRLSLRLKVVAMLDSLPDFDMSCKEWAKAARGALTDVMKTLVDSPPSVGGRVRVPSGAGSLSVAQIVGDAGSGPTIRTIHSAKGESHAATLLVAVDNGRTTNWESWLEDAESEEVRIAYVALTRAQQFCGLALPESCPKPVVDVYLDRGFVLG